MKKSDLEYGNVVEARNGYKYFVYHSGDEKALVNLITGWNIVLDVYNENLTNSDNFIQYDIMKVYKDYTCKELLWKRKEIPQLTEDEKVILRNLPEKYKWIARDENGLIFLYAKKPSKCEYSWGGCKYMLLPLEHLFQFIQWEDNEPYSIKELLKGEEK